MCNDHDMRTLVQVLKREKLLEDNPGRHHDGFNGFLFKQNISDYSKLKCRLIKHKDKLFRERRKMFRRRDIEQREARQRDQHNDNT